MFELYDGLEIGSTKVNYF